MFSRFLLSYHTVNYPLAHIKNIVSIYTKLKEKLSEQDICWINLNLLSAFAQWKVLLVAFLNSFTYTTAFTRIWETLYYVCQASAWQYFAVKKLYGTPKSAFNTLCQHTTFAGCSGAVNLRFAGEIIICHAAQAYIMEATIIVFLGNTHARLQTERVIRIWCHRIW